MKKRDELAVLLERIQDNIDENAHEAQDQEEYARHHNALVSRYNEKEARQKELQDRIADSKANAHLIANFIKNFEEAGA